MLTASLPAASLSPQLRLPALREGGRPAERSVDREVPRDDAVFEDAAAAVREVALLGKAIERAADRLRAVARSRRYVLGKVVAETPTGHENRLETAGASHSGERVGHRPDRRVDGKIRPVGGEAAAGGERIEAARPEHLVALRRPGRAVEVDEDHIEL